MRSELLRTCRPSHLFSCKLLNRHAPQPQAHPCHAIKLIGTGGPCKTPHSIHSISWKKERRMAAVLGDEQEPCKGHTLTQFVAQSPHDKSLLLVFEAFQAAVKEIANKISRAGVEGLLGSGNSTASRAAGRDAPKELDVVANDILKAALAGTGQVAAMASEEEDAAIKVETATGLYTAVFDPLDGSSNIAASIPTGTILGIYRMQGTAEQSVLQPGQALVAAAYALYSSATMIVVSLGQGTYGFTLAEGEFLLTHCIQIPSRGQMYSLNDARYHDWPQGLQRYIDNIRQGKGQSGKQYSARYVCSLVADFHRTLMYGGWAANPRNHLRLVYEANPLSFLAEQAGGRGTTGTERVLDIQPEKLHQRLPLFLGSPEDIMELEGYGDVQQLGSKKYCV